MIDRTPEIGIEDHMRLGAALDAKVGGKNFAVIAPETIGRSSLMRPADFPADADFEKIEMADLRLEDRAATPPLDAEVRSPATPPAPCAPRS